MYNRVNAFLCGICVGPRKYRALTLAASSHAHAETAAAHTLPTAQHSTSTHRRDPPAPLVRILRSRQGLGTLAAQL